MAWHRFCVKHGKELSEKEFDERLAGRANAEIFEFVFGRMLTGDEVQRYEAQKESLYRNLYKPVRKPLAGLMDLLRDLRGHGVPVGVGTMAPSENVSFILDGLGIRQWFQAVVDVGEITQGKPSPEVFLKAASKLRSPPEQCVVFEDSLSGVAAARAAVMKVVGVSTSLSPKDLRVADIVVSDFTGLTAKHLDDIIGHKTNGRANAK